MSTRVNQSADEFLELVNKPTYYPSYIVSSRYVSVLELARAKKTGRYYENNGKGYVIFYGVIGARGPKRWSK